MVEFAPASILSSLLCSLIGALLIGSIVTNSGVAQTPPLDISQQRLDLLQQTIALASTVEDEQDRARLLLDVARQYAALGLDDSATDLLSQILELALTLDTSQAKSSLLLALSHQHGDLGQAVIALEVADFAYDVALDIENSQSRAIALIDVAARYADLLEPARSANALNQATAAADRLQDRDEQAALLADLALQYADLGQYDRSSQLLARSQQAIAAARETDENSTPLDPRPWDGNIGLAGNVFSGERTRGVFTLLAGAERRWARDAFNVGVRVAYDFDEGRTDDETNISGQFTIEERHYFSTRWQYFVNSQVASDNFENLNLRATLTTGLGINLWRASSDERLDLQLGVGARYENFRDDGDDFNPISANVGLDYQDILLNDLRLNQTFSVGVPLDDAADYLIQSQTNLRIPIADNWSFDNLVRLTFSGEPGPDNPNLIFNLQTGIRYDF
ncbi:MAG: DUF481 domain-containing protein [Elainellaceae cyanobacterium]